MSLILLHITSFVYIVFLAIFYFKKARIADVENKIYKYLLFSNILGLLIEFGCFYAVAHMDEMRLFTFIITRLLLVYYLYFIFMYTSYVYIIAYKQEKKTNKLMNEFYDRISKLCTGGFVFTSIVISLLPMEYYNDGTYVYTYGSSVEFLRVVFMFIMGLWIFILIKKYKNIKVQKCIPVIIFILLAGIGGFIQTLYPYILLTTPIETIIIFLMFFTIENPDMKLLEEVHKSKEISDAANEEKTMFLYNMTQEIRNTTNDINANADMILESESIDEIQECAREIKGITSKFNSMTNELFDVSKIDAANIKVYNNKYNIKNILKEIVTTYDKVCKNNGIDFRVNIDHDVPEVLYGDSIGFKEVLNIIMDNSVKYTKEGFIEFDVNTIIKNDICRLIITIEDSGMGMKSEDINKMKIEDKSLSRANKLITLMNGTMMISSNYGFGTKVKIVLDQKIEFNINKDVLKYEEIYDNVKLLMVDDSDSGIKIIDKLIKGSNIRMDFAMNGKECIDKIKAYDKYDIILLDEQLSQISGEDLIKKIKGIRNFDIPVILLTKDNSYEYNDEFKKLGFSDYLLKPVKKDELLNKINMYVKKDK